MLVVEVSGDLRTLRPIIIFSALHVPTAWRVVISMEFLRKWKTLVYRLITSCNFGIR